MGIDRAQLGGSSAGFSWDLMHLHTDGLGSSGGSLRGGESWAPLLFHVFPGPSHMTSSPGLSRDPKTVKVEAARLLKIPVQNWPSITLTGFYWLKQAIGPTQTNVGAD